MLVRQRRLGVGRDADREHRRGHDAVDGRLVELVDEVQVVEGLDVGRRRSRSPRELAQRARGDALAGLEPARHALPQARQDAAGRAPDEQDLAVRPRAVADAEHPAVDEVGPDGLMRRARRACRRAARDASGRGRRRRPATRRSAAARPLGGRAGTARPRDRRRSGRIDRSAAGSGRSSARAWRGPASAAPGIPWTTGGASVGPAARRGQRCGQARPARASQSCPMHCATFQSPSPPGSVNASPGSASTKVVSAAASDPSCAPIASAVPGPPRRRTSRRT